MRMIRKNSVWQILEGIITETSVMKQVDFAKTQGLIPSLKAVSSVWSRHDLRHMSHDFNAVRHDVKLMVFSTKLLVQKLA